MAERRLHRRRLRLWQRDFLVNRRLWPNIQCAIEKALAASRATTAPLVLDVGCGQQPYRSCFGQSRYIGVDRTVDDSRPAVLGDACGLPIASGVIDIVFSTQVIEHVSRPCLMLREFHRVLKPGGSLVLTGPKYWPLHEEPFDFYRYTKKGFVYLMKLAGFIRWAVQEDGGDWAQIMLAINLKLTPRWTAPLRCAVNLLGLSLDRVSSSKLSPANYTIWAQR